MAIIVPIVSAWNNKGLNKAIADIQRAQGGFNKLGIATAAIGNQMVSTGKSLTRNLTVPMALAGGVAIKAAMEFEDSFGKIEGLVGVAKGDLKELEKAAKTLGPMYGQSANQAADSLFYITSAGLRGKDAIDVLEKSLKASAVGLGDAKTIADLTTSAINAYGKEILDAAQATDTLTAAIRLGKLEPAALASVIGNVLPVASFLGVKFHEVGAAFAAMSKTGTDAATAATQLRGIMSGLTKVTPKAEKQLAEFGLSGAGLRKQLREQGLLSVLQTLTDTFGDNEVAIANVFGNVRALTGVLDLMGANVESTNAIFAEMADSTGILDEAFAVTAETTKFQLAQAIADLKAIALEVGQVLIPVFTQTVIPAIKRVAASLIGLVERFKALSPQVKDTIVKFGLLVMAAGPLLFIGGKMLLALSSIMKFTGALQLAMTGTSIATKAATTGFAAALAPLAIAAGVITGVTLIIIALWRESEIFRNAVTKAFSAVRNAIIEAVNTIKSKLNENKLSLDALRTAFQFLGDFVGAVLIPIIRIYLVGAIKVLTFYMGLMIDIISLVIKFFRYLITGIGDLITRFNQAAAAGESFGGRVARSVQILFTPIGRLLSLINTVRKALGGTGQIADNFINKATSGLQESRDAARSRGRNTVPEKSFEDMFSDFITKMDDGSNGSSSKGTKAASKASKEAAEMAKELAKQSKKVASALGKMNDKLSAAREKLAQAKKAFASFRDGVRDSINGLLNFGDAAKDGTGSFLKNLRAQAAGIVSFAGKVQRLIQMGLSETAIQQVLAAGAEAGGRIADELIEGGASAIAETNRLVASVNSAATSLGQQGAAAFYQAGITQGQAMVNGIISAVQKAGFIIKGGAVALPKHLQKALDSGKLSKDNITELNKILKKIPALAEGGIVSKPTLALIGEAGPEAVVPLSKMSQGGNVYNITVNAGMGTSGAQIGREIVDAIKRYERTSGPVFASA